MCWQVGTCPQQLCMLMHAGQHPEKLGAEMLAGVCMRIIPHQLCTAAPVLLAAGMPHGGQGHALRGLHGRTQQQLGCMHGSCGPSKQDAHSMWQYGTAAGCDTGRCHAWLHTQRHACPLQAQHIAEWSMLCRGCTSAPLAFIIVCTAAACKYAAPFVVSACGPQADTTCGLWHASQLLLC